MSGHDESSSDVSVLHESFPVRNVETLRDLESGDTTCVGYGNDDVDHDAGGFEDGADVDRESVSHGHSRTIHRDTVENRIGAGKVDVFENVGSEGATRNALLDGNSFSSDDEGFS